MYSPAWITYGASRLDYYVILITRLYAIIPHILHVLHHHSSSYGSSHVLCDTV